MTQHQVSPLSTSLPLPTQQGYHKCLVLFQISIDVLPLLPRLQWVGRSKSLCRPVQTLRVLLSLVGWNSVDWKVAVHKISSSKSLLCYVTDKGSVSIQSWADNSWTSRTQLAKVSKSIHVRALLQSCFSFVAFSSAHACLSSLTAFGIPLRILYILPVYQLAWQNASSRPTEALSR